MINFQTSQTGLFAIIHINLGLTGTFLNKIPPKNPNMYKIRNYGSIYGTLLCCLLHWFSFKGLRSCLFLNFNSFSPPFIISLPDNLRMKFIKVWNRLHLARPRFVSLKNTYRTDFLFFGTQPKSLMYSSSDNKKISYVEK